MTMALNKQHQVPLVSATGTTQPPFPGGWVLAIFDAIHAFAPAFAAAQELPDISRTGTGSRLKQAVAVKTDTQQDLEAFVVRIITALFPRTASINRFAEEYVKEYFGLWATAADFAPNWAKAMGYEAAPSCVIARALFRDLVLRLCYLETCERKLNDESYGGWELCLLKSESLAHVYQTLIDTRTKPRGSTLEALARKLKVNEKSLRRFKKGESAPSLAHLHRLKPIAENGRLLAGIGFIDALLRKLKLRDGTLQKEVLHVSESFLPAHRRALDSFVEHIPHQNADGVVRTEPHAFESYIRIGTYLLLHPGLESIWSELPDALWRAHLYNLQFARIIDFAQAYYQFSEPENDCPLMAFFQNAERESSDCPYHWMTKLRERCNVLPFPPGDQHEPC